MDEQTSGEATGSRSEGWLLEKCPGCDAHALVAVLDVDEPNFLCEACGRCWHVELGYVSRVDPLTCMTCHHLGACVARLGPNGAVPLLGNASSVSSNEK